MFQNSRISIILRIICLIAFMLVIILNNSFITLVLLTIFFYAFTRNERGSLIFWLRILMIISFLISYFTSYWPLLKLVLIIGLAYYFIIDPYKDISIRKTKKIVIDKYFIRFKKNNIKRKDVIDMNLVNAIYITVHLFILFVTIMVG